MRIYLNGGGGLGQPDRDYQGLLAAITEPIGDCSALSGFVRVSWRFRGVAHWTYGIYQDEL